MKTPTPKRFTIRCRIEQLDRGFVMTIAETDLSACDLTQEPIEDVIRWARIGRSFVRLANAVRGDATLAKMEK